MSAAEATASAAFSFVRTSATLSAMQRFHRWFGVAMLVVFALTGQYMLRAHVAEMATGARLLYRSRHIYILFSGLLHLTLGTHVVRRWDRGPRTLQVVASALLAVGSGLLVAAFFADPPHVDLVPLALPVSRLGIAATAVGTIVHAVAGAIPVPKDGYRIAQT